ncbi:hypothetical protein PBI_INDLOVU_63 [Mycobacterium phage Indlovu]|nr:hypothetical protein PBI_INDLOVU_63 [Mycobacterium phage Indlovu]
MIESNHDIPNGSAGDYSRAGCRTRERPKATPSGHLEQSRPTG